MLKSHHPLFKKWCAIRNLYNNPNNRHYKYYGGRGLKLSTSWDTDFWTFVEDIESLGPRPNPDAILDRKNNNLGHSKRNCFWGNRHDNSNDRQSNMMVTYQGRTQSLADWSTELGINHRTLWSRLHDRGYTVKQAFTRSLHYGNFKH